VKKTNELSSTRKQIGISARFPLWRFFYDAHDVTGRLGHHWRWALPVTLLVVFPIGLELATGTFGFRDAVWPARFHPLATVSFKALSARLMSFGCMGLFRSVLPRESRLIRYLSDSAYWLYLAHLPLCIAAHAVISQWPLPVWIKLPLLSAVLTIFLLLTYQFLVRNTWVGRLLNRTPEAAREDAVDPFGWSRCRELGSAKE